MCIYIYRVGSNSGNLEDLGTYNDFPTTIGADFLDFIKLFYFSIVIQLFINIALVGFMHVVVEPFV